MPDKNKTQRMRDGDAAPAEWLAARQAVSPADGRPEPVFNPQTAISGEV